MPTSLAAFNRSALQPGLAVLHDLGGPAPCAAATRLLLAIARQEGGPGLKRFQDLGGGRKGPARGVWQFERGGAVQGVLHHPSSATLAQAACRHYGAIPITDRAVWATLEHCDGLAVAFARLLLWTDPRALPVHESDAWACYLRNWRPGRPHPKAWPENWAAAGEAMRATS